MKKLNKMKYFLSSFFMILFMTLNAQSSQVTTITKKDINDRTPLTPIEDLMPKRTLGVAVGAGFDNNFDESSFCVSGEALFRLNDPNPCGFYLGGDATYEYYSFNDWKSNAFEIGPKAQFHMPITPSKELQWVNGLSARYKFGSIDYDGFKEDLSGFNATLYTGLNVRLTESLSIGLELPVLGYENLTYESEGGSEFEEDNTSLLLNKRNPAKISARFSF